MNPDRAIQQLTALRSEADSPNIQASTPEHEAWKAKVEFVLGASLGKDSVMLKKFNEVSYSIGFWMGGPEEAARDAEYFRGAVAEAVALIDAAMYQLDLMIEAPVASAGSAAASPAGDSGPVIFLVHGHDGEAKHHAARVLRQLTGDEPVILHEQPSGGRTVIEKLDQYANPATAAVVLLTADDHASSVAADVLKARARQNVVFELGYFIGRLGRSNVVALTKGGIEIPSDINGVVYIDMDQANWAIELAKELAHIPGLSVDLRHLKS